MLRRKFVSVAAALFGASATAKAAQELPKAASEPRKMIDCWSGVWRRVPAAIEARPCPGE